MPGTPDNTDPASWHRYFAVEANNRAWTLAEGRAGDSDDAALLDAAHAAAWHWQAAGTELHRMRATMLLAHAHALAGRGESAFAYAEGMRRYFLARPDTPDWELAFAQAIYANAARVAGRSQEYREAYRAAAAGVAAVRDPEDREAVLRTFRQVPPPDEGRAESPPRP